jgi:hypothetical protein
MPTGEMDMLPTGGLLKGGPEKGGLQKGGNIKYMSMPDDSDDDSIAPSKDTVDRYYSMIEERDGPRAAATAAAAATAFVCADSDVDVHTQTRPHINSNTSMLDEEIDQLEKIYVDTESETKNCSPNSRMYDGCNLADVTADDFTLDFAYPNREFGDAESELKDEEVHIHKQYIYTHTHTYTGIYIHIRTYTHIYTHIHTYTHTLTHTYIRICIRI